MSEGVLQIVSSLASRFVYAAALAVAYLYAASAAAHSFLTSYGPVISAGWEKVLHFDQVRPFVYRVLMPAAVNAAVQVVPRGVQERLMEVAITGRPPFAQDAAAVYRWEGGPSFSMMVYLGLVVACFFGVAWAWRAVCRHHTAASPLAADVAPLVALLLLPATFVRHGHLYDAAELLFAATALFLVLQRRFALYYPLLAVAMLNKETAFLMGAFFVALLPQLGWRGLARHAALHVLVGGAMLAVLWDAFASVPGHRAEYHLADNLAFWLGGEWLVRVYDPYVPGVPLPAGLNALLLLFLALVLRSALRRPERGLALAFLASVGVVLPFFLYGGYEDEIRVFGPSFALLVPLALQEIVRY